MSKTKTLTGASFATVLSLAMSQSALAGPPEYFTEQGWVENGWRSQYEETVAHAPAPTNILLPTANSSVLACDRGAIADNPLLANQLLGGSDTSIAGSQAAYGRSNLAATAGGAMIGVLAGEPMVDRVPTADAACAQYSLSNAANGETVAWNSPEYGRDFAFTSRQTNAVPGEQNCREFTGESYANGETTSMVGTACERPNGQWKIVN